jgi:hypothetical protein
LSLAISETTTIPILPTKPAYYDYAVYGLRVRSRIELTLDTIPVEGAADVELLPGQFEEFAEVRSQLELDPAEWIHHHELPNGWSYLRYDELFEFLVSPTGDQIVYRLLAEVPLESFQTYALGRVFSFALVKLGHEPLHAATIVVNGRAVAFLGASTYGKSSLAACFIAAGHRLLTDDTLRLEERDGQWIAYPGPPRLRLLPKVARLYLGSTDAGEIMNPREKDLPSPKLVFRMSAEQSFSEVAPLEAIYMLTGPRKVYRKQRIMVAPVPAIDGLINLLKYSHNHSVTNQTRLQRQFAVAHRIITEVKLRLLAYPRVLNSLDDVRDTILKDLER